MRRFLLLGALCVATRGQQPDKPLHEWWLRGRVVDAAGKPVAGAGIASAETGRILTEDALDRPLTKSKEDGTFEFRLAPPARSGASLELMVASPGHVALRWYQYGAPKEAPKEPTDLGDLRLPTGGTLKGRVRGPDGMAMPDVRVTATDWVASFPSLNTQRSAFSATRTGQDGAFVLPCAITEGALLRAYGPGCFLKSLGPVSAGEPIMFELRHSGWIEGKATDADGQPVQALVSVQYESEAGADPAVVTSGPDGAFKLPLRYPSRYRVAATLASTKGRGETEVKEGPIADLVITVAVTAKTGAVRVRALEAGSGAVIRKFKAAEYWYQHPDQTWLENYLAEQGEDSEPDGTMLLRGPQGQNTTAGTIRVSADGCAPLLLTDVQPKDGEETVLEAKLKKESVVTGTVVDEATGEPVADVEVQYKTASEGNQRVFYGGTQQRRFGRRPQSAADGSFRLGGLGKGTFEIWAMHKSRPDGRTVTVTLGDEDQKADVRLTIPKGWALAGKLVGTQLPSGCRVRYQRETPGYYGSSSVGEEEAIGDASTIVPLGADGTFRFTGLAPGGYDLLLIWPSPPRTGAVFRLPIERLRLKRTDWQRDIDVSLDVPGSVRGKVAIDGTRMRAGRFVVGAAEIADPNNAMSRVYSHSDNHLAGRRALVAADGSFELLLGPAEYRLQVVDLMTGVLLGKDTERIVVTADKPVTRDLKVVVVPARVRLVSEVQGAVWSASRLKIEAAVEPDKNQAGAVVFSSGNPTGGAGFDLSEHPDEVEFLLPPGDAKLMVYSGSNRLSRKQRYVQPASLGDVSLTVKAGEPAVATLKIGARPEITDEDKEGKAEGEVDATVKRVAPAPAVQPARR
jgi:hypothetical protein